GYRVPIAGFDVMHIVGKRIGMHGDFGMRMPAENLRTFDADGSVAEGGTFSADSDDPYVLWHTPERSLIGKYVCDLVMGDAAIVVNHHRLHLGGHNRSVNIGARERFDR